MSQHVPATLRVQIQSAAKGRCAYCRNAETLLGVTFEVDHIVPQSAGGQTSIDNLCLSCPTCNRRKAARQAAPDPLSGETARTYLVDVEIGGLTLPGIEVIGD
ncbi:MAG: HNH endonuclease, partial [Anaerolinea sp.]|nr:HNH endonuclease [Anaerolinea sp.]